ncbi:MAG: pyruvate formate lyase-activating protein [Chloroflexi bacterium]|nr:pyruvate formate lyase-activating protein [Chloroflexota bacterium]
MRILAVDIGTGTQDILLFDTSKLVHNCVKMIMPSPTALLAERISKATALGHPVLFVGVTMGGGPAKRALTRHTRSGLAAYATTEAALTFHDDLDVVRGMGVTILAAEERPHLPDLEVLELKDLDLKAIGQALDAFGVDNSFDALAVAVLDHGFAPPGVSNRLFRFDHLRRLMAQQNKLGAFAYLRHELPDYLTRMKAAASSAEVDVPLLLLDTGVAAALGALQDSEVSQHDDVVTVNAGNSHTVAFHLHGDSIAGFFEHHSGLLDPAHMDLLVTKLVRGTLTNKEVYDDGGHGAVIITGEQGQDQPFVAVTGPRRYLMAGSSLNPYHAVPHGDMMLAGCYGLVSACALRMEVWRGEIQQALNQNT